jgi:hypothetical protein
MLPIIWKSDLSWRKKFHASMHLLGSTVFVMAFVVALLSAPLAVLHEHVKDLSFFIYFFPVFYFSMFALSIVYFYSHVDVPGRKTGNYLARFFEFITIYPAFMAMSVGFSLHNTVAVFQGWLGKKSAFIRTPKFNIVEKKDNDKNKDNYKMKVSWVVVLEGILACYFAVMVVLAFREGGSTFIVYPLLNCIGFAFVCAASLKSLSLK